MISGMKHTTRRGLLQSAGGAVALLTVGPARATPDTMKAAIAKVIGEGKVTPGKVSLDLPPLVENGNTVACGVSVESPMTPTDYVKAVHIFNEKNPQPNVISVHLGPRAGKASVQTRIRLADSQNIIAIAEMSDGSLWSDSVEVIITLGACLEDPL